VLYDDGEDEWVDLEGEELTWHCQLAGHSGVYPGLARGTAPAGTDALGWRVGVYWAADQAFYSGEVVGYDAATGRHEVAYDDGEEGPLVLGADRVKWILPPGAAVDRERLETAAEARGRRRGGDESDPDYEAVRRGVVSRCGCVRVRVRVRVRGRWRASLCLPVLLPGCSATACTAMQAAFKRLSPSVSIHLEMLLTHAPASPSFPSHPATV
jgi:hypothetical protein